MLRRSLIGLVSFRRPDRRLRVAFRERVRPGLKRESHDLQRAIVTGKETFTQPVLRLVPVFGICRFQAAAKDHDEDAIER